MNKNIKSIIREFIQESDLLMDQKIATPKEIERLRQYIYDIVDKFAFNQDSYEEGFVYNLDRLLRKPEGTSVFTRKNINSETLTSQERQEWEKNRIENIKSIGKLIKELVVEYDEQYESETDRIKKGRILWVINALTNEYELYYTHIIEPQSYKIDESKITLKNIIKESILESDLLEDYPASFDMEVFKSLRSHAGRNRYAQEHLQRLSSGSSRIVYKIDDEKVLKLAKNDKGVAQNEVEIEYGQYDGIQDVVAKIFDYDEENNLWVEMELAKRVKKSDFKNIIGYSFEDYQTAIHNYGIDSGNSRGFKYPIDKEILEDMWENEFMYEMFSFIGDYGVPTGDLERTSSYGLVKRNGQDAIVLIDYGLTHQVYSSYYS